MFLTPYVKFTQDFYTEESTRLSSEKKSEQGRKEFLLHCHTRIEEEKERMRDVLGSYDWCWDEIEHITEKALLTGRLEWLSQSKLIFRLRLDKV